MFANNRIDKLIGLNTYEINSIGTNSNAKKKEVPCGKNKEKNSNPCILTHIILIPINKKRLNANVTIK